MSVRVLKHAHSKKKARNISWLLDSICVKYLAFGLH